MGIALHNGKYVLDYRFKGRRIRETVGPNKRMAEQALAVRKTEIVQGRYQIKPRRSVTFGDFTVTYLAYSRANKRSWHRDQTLLKNLLPWFGSRQLEDISPLHIEAYKQERMKAVRPATVNRELILFKAMFNKAIEWGKAFANPMRSVKMLRVENFQERILNPVEIIKLLAACTDHSRPIVVTALNTGMRLNEILTLKWEQVDLERRVITILFSKNGRVRRIPINNTLLRTLSALHGLPGMSEHVFTYARTRLPIASMRTAWLSAVRRAGIPHCRFHDLRHTFASRLVSAGADLVTVKELLGHSSITMTMRYAHSAPEHKRRAVALLDAAPVADSGHLLDTSPIRHKRHKLVSYSIPR